MENGISLIILGLLAAPKLVLDKIPALGGLVSLLQKVESYIGLLAILWGIWSIFQCVIHINLMSSYINLMSSNILWWVTWLVGAIVVLLLGIILGLNILIGNVIPTIKGAAILLVLQPYKKTLAITALLLGIWTIVIQFI